ncbi:hypothetical protein HELRODRAFT_91074 [Helobdella robusta]|uniref:Paramyosin n=1 Tax=Helobdella robusta TaxID=6412 RepID=T1G7Z5_HELRO|nr:hypothetical protein HELRODRAFT_91074 [Helobdella robusta]ESN90090.1 hypothetical protein HELRODRAFT_91074 [Helobdella robusta]
MKKIERPPIPHYILFFTQIQSDLEDKCTELTQLTDQSRKAMEEASLLAEELRLEQERGAEIDRNSRSLENRMKDLQSKLHEVEAAAMQGGHKVVQRMEQRIHELEMELENEHHQHSETTHTHKRRQERRLRELLSSSQESQEDQSKLQEAVEKLHHKLKAYKRQVDELEEASKMNMAKYKKTQQEMEHVIERANMAETSLYNLRARNSARSSSVAPFDRVAAGGDFATTTGGGGSSGGEFSMKNFRPGRASSEIKQAAPLFDL